MVKTTLRGAILLGLLVWSGTSFAEVQSVQISGDVTVRSFYRDNLDLHGDNDATDSNNFFMQTTGVNIGADLTENVSAFLRIVNERDWNRSTAEGTSDIDLSQAYVTLSEVFYSPLTLRLGTQPLWFGRGFIIGSTLLPGVVLGGADPNAAISADEYTDFTSFDAIRATFDLAGVAALDLPIVLDVVYSKIDENSVAGSDDVTLFGFNAATEFDALESEAEIYYWNKRDKSRTGTGADDTGTVNTIGLRGSARPAEGFYTFGELAFQFGQRAPDATGVTVAGSSQQAWAADLGIEYTLADLATSPTLGAEWIYWSGKDVNGAAGGWDPMFRGYFTTALREFQATSLYPTDQLNDTASVTNQHQLAVYGTFNPVEDLSVSPRLTWFILDVGAIPVAGANREHYAGMEWDTQVLYDYTDDVQLGLLYALFAPGSVYRTPNDATAQQLVTTVSVKF